MATGHLRLYATNERPSSWWFGALWFGGVQGWNLTKGPFESCVVCFFLSPTSFWPLGANGGRGPQAIVHVSMYQGSIVGTYFGPTAKCQLWCHLPFSQEDLTGNCGHRAPSLGEGHDLVELGW